MNNLFQGQKKQGMEGGISQTNPFKETMERIANQGQIKERLENFERPTTLHDFNMERSFQNIKLGEGSINMTGTHSNIHMNPMGVQNNQIFIDHHPNLEIEKSSQMNNVNSFENNLSLNAFQKSYSYDPMHSMGMTNMNYMPMGQIHPMLLELNKQLQSESKNKLEVQVENQNIGEKDKEIDPENNNELLQDIINTMEGQDDERHHNSEFLKFIKRMQTGEIKLNEKANNIDDMNAEKLFEGGKSDEEAMENIFGKLGDYMNVNEGNIYGEKKESLFMKDNPYISVNFDSEIEKQKDIPSDLIEHSQNLLSKGEIIEARFALEAEVQNNPDNAEAWLNLGRIHTENDRDDFAMECFLKALEADPFNAEALLALGISCTNEFDEFDAMIHLRNWIKRHHIYNKYVDNNNPLLDYTIIKQEQQTDRDEEDVYSKALRIQGLIDNFNKEMCNLMETIAVNEPNAAHDTDLWIAMGIAQFIPHNNERAIECFRRAVEINPKDYNAWNKLGAILAHSKMNDEALQTYKKCLQLKPNYARCWANLGIALFNLNDFHESMKAFISALKVFDNIPHVWSYMSSVAMAMNSKEIYEMVTKRDLKSLIGKFGVV